MRLFVFLVLASQKVIGAPCLSSSVTGCLSCSKVPQKVPGSDSFAQDIIPYNIRLNFTPIAFAVPTTVPQVQAAVMCAAKFGVKVNPKSGGHSYASHSIGGEDGHLVVDLKYFNDVTLDTTTNLATVGPGTRLGNLALALYNKGGRAIAHGVCPG
jgi:FAD/FMN-containing dehydrogenase